MLQHPFSFVRSNRLDKEVAAHKKTDDSLKAAQRKLSDKESQLLMVNQEARSLESVLQELRKECQELKDSLESAKYTLEQETLTRVDLENKLQSKEEELSFKKEMYNKVMSFSVSYVHVDILRKCTVQFMYLA